MADILTTANRIVFKIGSSTLLDDDGNIDGATIHHLAALWSNLHREGKEVILVSSGAVALGRPQLSHENKGEAIPSKQAAAAVGQSKLMSLYDTFFSVCGISVAQILLTRGDLADRKRYINARNTLNILLSERIIPIINENDTIAFEELKFGENDTLAVLVGGLLDADLVILLSDIYGLYTSDPRKNKDAKHIDTVTEITDEIIALAGGVGSRVGSGGMKSKVDAAKISVQSGIPLAITMGKDVNNIRDCLNGKGKFTLFIPTEHGLKQRDRWIAHGSAVEGAITIDDGAVIALSLHKSLLPVGVKSIEGHFAEGSVVTVKDKCGKKIARGITNYSATKIEAIKGKHCCEGDITEVIHCDNLVLED
jgi:glutamate 5-kinase